jgi:hypothetical protein
LQRLFDETYRADAGVRINLEPKLETPIKCISAAERSLTLACERESAANERAQNMEELLQEAKEQVAAAEAEKKGLQAQILEVVTQGRMREVGLRLQSFSTRILCLILQTDCLITIAWLPHAFVAKCLISE